MKTATVKTYEDVLKADVAMSDVECVKVVDSVEQLQHDAADITLRVAELVSRHNTVVQVATLHTHTRIRLIE